jgi:hypothetical protein
MARRNRSVPPKDSNGEQNRQSELIAGKHGIYLVRGSGKLKSIQLIPWEQIVPTLPPTQA